ncbi:MAG: hypothetical protein ACRELG_15545 [Gemmataceae bacterium]
MTRIHVFAETNFLFGLFCLPSKRQTRTLALRARFDAREIELYIPYLCFQETRHLIGKTLRNTRGADLLEFHRFAERTGIATWDFAEVKKLYDAANAEVNRAKAIYQRELSALADALGERILHGTKDVFDFLESLDLDNDDLRYNDKLILCSILVKAKELLTSGERQLYFASLDKSDLAPTVQRPKMARYYANAGLTFISEFVLPDPISPRPE